MADDVAQSSLQNSNFTSDRSDVGGANSNLRKNERDEILYDLAILAEWPQEAENFHKSGKEKSSVISRLQFSPQFAAWTFIRNVGFPLPSSSPRHLPSDLLRLVNSQIPWQVAVSSDGRDVALLQDQGVEIRSARDEFTAVIGRCSVSRDPHPQWRRLAWSGDGTLLACSDSEGNVTVLDLVATRICQLTSTKDAKPSLPNDLGRAACALIFVEYAKDDEWSYELLVLTYQGVLSSYLIDSTDSTYKLQHRFHFAQFYKYGVSTAIFDEVRKVLLVGGTVTKSSTVNEPNARVANAADEGLTVWRRLEFLPYWKRVTSSDEDAESHRVHGLWTKLRAHLSTYWSSGPVDGVYKLCQSPPAAEELLEGAPSSGGALVVSIHLSGRLAVWSLPALVLQRSWSQDEQPGTEAVNPETMEMAWTRKAPKEFSFVPNLIDVNWWSDVALILARCSGAVTVSSVKTLKNLLGKSPEWFEPSPQVSLAHDGGFLSLECESTYVGLKRHLSADDEDDFADDDDLTYVQRCSNYAKQVMFYITDSERFQPPRKRPKLVSKTYRLISLKSTTPEELYARKIDKEEYGEALELAKAYNLDCDMVYQRQWRKTPVSVASIQDYLTKISKRSWVLHECLEPTHKEINIDAMRELLLYGLRGTGLRALITIGKNQDRGKFILCDDDDDDDDDSDYYDDDEYLSLDAPHRMTPDEAGERTARERRLEERKRKERALLEEVDFSREKRTLAMDVNSYYKFHRLTLEQRELCRARFKILQYLDRLATYEVMLGGPEAAESRFDYTFYHKFRAQNIVEAAAEFARDGDWKSVDCLFTYHGDVTLEHRLPLLSNFLETLSPREYRDLLPEVGSRVDDAGIVEWPQERTRECDWCETTPCRSVVEPTRQDLGAFLYQENGDCRQFRGDRPSTATLTEWYCYRACEIERMSRLTDHALELVHLGLERGVSGLSHLYDDLVTMETLVYEGLVGDEIDFDRLMSMSSLEKLQLLMSRSSVEMYDKDLRRWLVPYLERCEVQEPGSYNALLHDYLVELARHDLKPCLRVFMSSKVHQRGPIIRQETDLLNMAVDCIYACERDDVLSDIALIIDCLPQRKDENSTTPDYIRLHNCVDELEEHFRAAECLKLHGCPKSLTYIQSTQSDFDETKSLMTRLCRLKGGSKPRPTRLDWHKLLADMLDLSSRVFKSLQPKLCTEIYTEGLLSSAIVDSIILAGDMIETHKDGADGDAALPSVMQQPKVPYRRAVELLVSASQAYFNSSANLNDSCLELAKACLSLIDDENEEVNAERDLIGAMALLHEYGVQILPLKVRLCKDRLSLVSTALASRTIAYQDSAKLLRLGQLLRVAEDEVGPVLRLVTQAALKADDHRVAYRHCKTLIERGYGNVWPECQTLAQNEKFTDVNAKVELLSFAVTHCLPERIEPILRAKCLLETQVLYDEINARIQLSPHRKPRPNQASTTAAAQFSASGVLGQAKNILSSTQRTTSTVLANMGQSQWWKQTLSELPSMLETEGENMKEEEKFVNEELVVQGLHPFYEDYVDDALKLSVGYTSLVPSERQPTVNEMVLRKAQLEETVTEGQTKHDSMSVLLGLAKETMHKDTTLGLAYLLALNNMTDAEVCFELLPRTVVTLQLASYYYALQVYNLLKPQHRDPGPHSMYDLDPQRLIDDVVKMDQSTSTSSSGDDVTELMGRLRKYNDLLSDFMQGQLLQSLDKGVDVARFTKDNEYKHETILGLAMTAEDSVFKIARTLASKYELSEWDLYMTHLDFLFCDSGFSTTEVETRVSNMDFVPQLKERPQDFTRDMFAKIYPGILGSDHSRLLYYYQLLEGCQTSEPVSPEQHVRLLRKIKPSLPGLDYKTFTSGKSDPLDVLQPLLNTTNVHVIAKLANKIPDQNGGYLQPGAVFACWAGKFFWHGDQSTKKAPETKADWIHRYENCGQFLPKMAAGDLVRFLDHVTFSDQSLGLLLECRQEILKRALKFSRQQAGKRKAGEETGTVTWNDAVEHLKQSSAHLECLSNETIVAMTMAEAESIRSYGTLIHLSRGEEEKLLDVYRRMYMDGQGPELVDDILTVLPLGRETPISLLQRTVQYLVQKIKDGNTDRDPILAMTNLVRSVADHQDNGGEMIGQGDIMSLLREFCNDVMVEVKPRLDVLLVLEKAFTLSDDDVIMLTLYRTEAVLAAAWNDLQVELNDVTDDDSRHALFRRALDQSSSLDHFKAIRDLLLVWPQLKANETETKSPERHPWTSLLAAMTSSLKAEAGVKAEVEVVDMARDLINIQNVCFSNECTRYLYHSLREVSLEGALKLVLLSGQDALYAEVTQSLLENEELCVDEELVELILQRHLVPAILPSKYYGHVIDHLLTSQRAERYDVRTVARQLEEAGYQAEAGSLLLQYRGSHPFLNTFDGALSAVKYWLGK